MRVGFVSMQDPDSPSAISGMPFAIKQQLLRLGHEVVNVVPEESRATRLKRSVTRRVPEGMRRKLKQTFSDAYERGLALMGTSRWRAPPDDEAIFQDQIRRASALSRALAPRIAAQTPPLDVLVGVCISVPLYALEVRQPIIYFSDTTASIILRSYPSWREQPAGWHRACEEFERVALKRTTRAIFATELACRSAVDDFGMDPARVSCIPLGANVVPDAALLERARAVPAPSRQDLRLVIIAADPVRKQLDLAIDTCEALRREGIAATLTYVGPPTARAQEYPHVHCAGRLELTRAEDRQRNLELLAQSHVMLLPSLGEAFGIAVAEAAHLGKPSVVSDAGGLPEVVDAGRTGLVLPLAAGAAEYAAAVRDLALNPARYAAFSAAALERARGVLHWDRFGERLGALIDEVVPPGRARAA